MSVKPPELNCKLRFLIMPRDVCVPNLAAIIKVLDSYISRICSLNLSEEVSDCLMYAHINVNIIKFDEILTLLIHIFQSHNKLRHIQIYLLESRRSRMYDKNLTRKPQYQKSHS